MTSTTVAHIQQLDLPLYCSYTHVMIYGDTISKDSEKFRSSKEHSNAMKISTHENLKQNQTKQRNQITEKTT